MSFLLVLAAVCDPRIAETSDYLYPGSFLSTLGYLSCGNLDVEEKYWEDLNWSNIPFPVTVERPRYKPTLEDLERRIRELEFAEWLRSQR